MSTTRTIHFKCPSCHQSLSAPVDCAGWTSRCRQCNHPVTVPPPPTLSSPPSSIPVPLVQLIAGALVVIAASLFLMAMMWLSDNFERDRAHEEILRKRQWLHGSP